MRRRTGNQANTIFCLLLSILFAVSAMGCDPGDPVLNTVRTAHGNTDWHIDTAEEFLYGTEMDGDASAANHVPDTWSKAHMHVGMTGTNSFYHDSSLSGTGADDDIYDGIDRAMLFFYAGHGSPGGFDTLGNWATPSDMLLGNNAENNYGLLRYYWQCSCEVFAHGPESPSECSSTGSSWDYSCPGDFDGSADTSSMRNVYERWGAAIDPRLRMACGSSTSAWCHQSETNRIWDNYNNKSWDVADSFIWGLYRNASNVPLCMTRGNWSVSETPLFDATFTNKPNPVGDGLYLHLQYLSQFRKNPPWPMVVIVIPELIPIYEFEPLPLPEPYQEIKFKSDEYFLVSEDQIEDRGAKIRIHNNSGAVYVAGIRQKEIKETLSEDRYLSNALSFIKEQGWSEDYAYEPMGSYMNLQTAPEKDQAKTDIKNEVKNVIVEIKRRIPVATKEKTVMIPVLGAGGAMEVQMNNDGTVFNASKVWRKITNLQSPKMVKTKPYEAAFKEALEQLGKTEYYTLDQWAFGYKEAAGNVKQTQAEVVYQFEFVPVSKKLLQDYPPRTVEVRGILD